MELTRLISCLGLLLVTPVCLVLLSMPQVGFTPKAQLIKEGADKGKNRRESSSSSESEASSNEDKDSQSESDLSSEEDSGTSSSDSDSAEEEGDVGPAIRMVRELQGADHQLNRQLHSQKLQLLDSSTRCIDADAPPPRRVLEEDAAAEPSEHLFFDGELPEEEGPWAGAETDTDPDLSQSDDGEVTGHRVLQHIQGSSTSQHLLADLVYGNPRGNPVGSCGSQQKKGKAQRDGKLSLFEDSEGSTSGSDGEGGIREPDHEKRSGSRTLYGNLPLPPNASGLSPDFDSGDAPAEEAAAVYRAVGIDPDDPTEIDAFWTPQLIAAIKVSQLPLLLPGLLLLWPPNHLNAIFIDAGALWLCIRLLGRLHSVWFLYMHWPQRRFFITGGWQELEQAKEAAKQQSAAAVQATDEQEEQRKSMGHNVPAVLVLWLNSPRPLSSSQCGRSLAPRSSSRALSKGVSAYLRLRSAGEEQQQQGVTAAHKAFEGSEEAMGGFAIGTYVKICIANLPQQWLEGLDPSRPVILGGLNAGELQCTFMQVFSFPPILTVRPALQ